MSTSAKPVPLGLRDYVTAFAAAGAIAGLGLAAVEAAERSFAVRRSLQGTAEHLDFALQFALTAPAVALVGVVAGIAVGGAVLAARSWRARLVALAVVVLLALLATPLWRTLAVRFAYYTHLPKTFQWEALAPLVALLFVVPLGLSIFAVNRLLAGRIGRYWRIAAFVCLFVFAGLGYYADSHAIVGLQDDSMHLAFGAVAVGSAVGCGLLAWVAVRGRRGVALALAVAMGLATLAAGGAARRLNANPVVSALFWTRGIFAPRVALALERAADRDGDGFSSAFGGGDPDDSDPTSNPLARDVAGDGRDANGIGGDPASWTGPDPTDAASFPHVAPPPGPGRRNVLFISIDTLRADHLSCYGYRRPTSPNIDAFAAKGALFEHAAAQGTSTGHSFASMLTGAYADDIFDPAQPRLGALLGKSGYVTAWLNSAPYRRFINRDQYWLHYRDIMGDGFTPVDNAAHHSRQAAELVDDTIAYLDSAPKDKPLFTWVHFRDPHALYLRHDGFDFGKRAIDRYDSEIAYTDNNLGRLFAWLEQSGALEDTLVVITSDHGESFGEHGDYTHHRRPYWTLANVPLIVRWPGASGVRVASAAGPVDIAPTILNWAGLADPGRFDGIDLRWQAAQPASALASRVVVTETPRNCPEASFLAWSVTEGDLHLIYDAYGPRVELFDVGDDPFEVRNLATDRPEETARLLGILGRWLDRMSDRPGFTNWAQYQPSLWAAATKLAEPPPRPDEPFDPDDDGGEGD